MMQQNINYGGQRVSLDDLAFANRAAREPEFAFSWLDARSCLTLLVRGESGYYCQDLDIQESEVDALNERIGVSPLQKKAMQFGSAFSWDAPAARVEFHEKRQAVAV